MVALAGVGGEASSIDAGFIKADVNQAKRVPGDRPIGWPDREKASRAVAEYLGVPDRARDGENEGVGIHGYLALGQTLWRKAIGTAALDVQRTFSGCA